MTWEAAERAAEGEIAAEAQRRASLARGAELIAAQQAEGVLPAELPTELLQLAIHALALVSAWLSADDADDHRKGPHGSRVPGGNGPPSSMTSRARIVRED